MTQIVEVIKLVQRIVQGKNLAAKLNFLASLFPFARISQIFEIFLQQNSSQTLFL